MKLVHALIEPQCLIMFQSVLYSNFVHIGLDPAPFGCFNPRGLEISKVIGKIIIRCFPSCLCLLSLLAPSVPRQSTAQLE